MNKLRHPALRLAVLVASLAVWESLVRLLRIPAFILPAPSQIGVAFYRGAVSGISLRVQSSITVVEEVL